METPSRRTSASRKCRPTTGCRVARSCCPALCEPIAPIGAAEVEELAVANMIDVDTASERYLPAVVVRLVTAIEARGARRPSRQSGRVPRGLGVGLDGGRRCGRVGR